MQRSLTDLEKINIICDYKSGLGLADLVVKYGRTRKSLWQFLRRRGATIREIQGSRKHRFDDKYFAAIDTPDKAYWLGFIYADGNVYSRTFSINLSRKDRQHLVLLSATLKYSGDLEDRFYIRKGKKILLTRFRLNSVKFCNALGSHGVVPRKSLIIRMPSIAKNLIRDFIRGYLDGDGWITKKQRSGNRYEWTVGFVSGSEIFIREIKKHIQYLCSISTGSVYKIKNKNAWQLTFDGNRVSKVISACLYYDGCVALERKRKKAQDCSLSLEEVSNG